MTKSVLVQPGARFVCFDIKNFYLDTPLEILEYMCIKLTDIPQEFIDEYDLTKSERAGWIYFSILCSCYGLERPDSCPMTS